MRYTTFHRKRHKERHFDAELVSFYNRHEITLKYLTHSVRKMGKTSLRKEIISHFDRIRKKFGYTVLMEKLGAYSIDAAVEYGRKLVEQQRQQDRQLRADNAIDSGGA